MSHWAYGLGPMGWIIHGLACIGSPRLGENLPSSSFSVLLDKKLITQIIEFSFDLDLLCMSCKLHAVFFSI